MRRATNATGVFAAPSRSCERPIDLNRCDGKPPSRWYAQPSMKLGRRSHRSCRTTEANPYPLLPGIGTAPYVASGAEPNGLRGLHPQDAEPAAIGRHFRRDRDFHGEVGDPGPAYEAIMVDVSRLAVGSRWTAVGSSLDGPGLRMTHSEQWLHQSLCQLEQQQSNQAAGQCHERYRRRAAARNGTIRAPAGRE